MSDIYNNDAAVLEEHEAAHAEGAGGNLEHDNSTNTPVDLHKKFFKEIEKLGSASGEGSSALQRLYMRCIRAAADGLISNEKPKTGKSDAEAIYEAYTTADSKKAEHTAGGAKANRAKLNAVIGLGCSTSVDGVEIANRAVEIWEKMTKADKKPKALAAGLVDVARAQKDTPVELTDDEIEEALSKTPVDKSVEKEWRAIHKKIEGLVTGENAAALKDNSSEAIQIEELVRSHLATFTLAQENEEFIKLCMARGMTCEQARAAAELRG